jgi:nucleotide-binding universal stress UspA family protein
VTSSNAVELAVFIAAACAAELTVVHVAERAAYSHIGPDTAALQAIAQGALDAAVLRVRDDFPKARGVLLLGHAGEELVAYTKQNDVDLLVCATHGRQSLERLFLGSVAEKLVRSCPCPVLTVRHAAGPFRRVLCASDASPSSQRAVELAKELAATFDANLTLVHVLDDGASDEALRDARAQLEESASTAKIHGANYDVVVRRGRAASEICAEAANGYDLVVVGTHGRNALSTMLLGSVATEVIRSCDAPVLSARSR